MTSGTDSLFKPLVLCADDFAVHASASRGIATLAAAGRLSATSVMVLSPRWGQDVALLRELRGRLDVGLHLDWTSEFAQRVGHGVSLPRAMLKSVVGGFDPRAARGVVERQLDAFEAQWKEPPDHVDGHQHVQQFAGIREALVKALVSRYGSRSPYLRISRSPPGLADFKSRLIAGLGAHALETRASKSGVARAAGLSGIYDFEGSVVSYAQCMARWLSLSPPGCIIMCHPAQGIDTEDAIGAARQREFEHLASPAFAQALALARVRVARGSETWATLESPR